MPKEVVIPGWPFAGPPPSTIVLLGMGPSLSGWTSRAMTHGNWREMPNKPFVIGLNNVASVIDCDLCICMDDIVEMLEKPHKDAAFWDTSNKNFCRWLQSAEIPILTSRAYPEKYPKTIDYPLDWVIEMMHVRGYGINNTGAYAAALCWAIARARYDADPNVAPLIVECHGMDYAASADSHMKRRAFLEEGRACTESILFAAQVIGLISYTVTDSTTLFDTKQGRPFYGYADGRKAINQAQQENANEPDPESRIVTRQDIIDGTPGTTAGDAADGGSSGGHGGRNGDGIGGTDHTASRRADISGETKSAGDDAADECRDAEELRAPGT